MRLPDGKLCPTKMCIRDRVSPGHIPWEVLVLRAPFQVEASVAAGDVIFLAESEAGRGVVDPLGLAFEFEKCSDGGFIERDGTGRVIAAEFGAVFFVAERGLEAEPRCV